MTTVHTVPIGDLIDHEAPADPIQGRAGRWLSVQELPGDNLGECPCGPRVEPVVDPHSGAIGWHIVHHSLDNREQAERAGG